MELELQTVTNENATEVAPHRFSTWSSDLGITARYIAEHGWPAQLETTLGNGQPFLARSKKIDREGDLAYVRYEQGNGCLALKVFND